MVGGGNFKVSKHNVRKSIDFRKPVKIYCRYASISLYYVIKFIPLGTFFKVCYENVQDEFVITDVTSNFVINTCTFDTNTPIYCNETNNSQIRYGKIELKNDLSLFWPTHQDVFYRF